MGGYIGIKGEVDAKKRSERRKRDGREKETMNAKEDEGQDMEERGILEQGESGI